MNAVTPHPKWQPQKRVEKSQPLRQRHGQYVGLVGQMDVQFGQPIAPAPAEEKGREAAAGRPEARIVRIVLALTGVSRSTPSPPASAPWRSLARSGGEGRPQEPLAKQQGLRGGAPGAPCFGAADEALNASALHWWNRLKWLADNPCPALRCPGVVAASERKIFL